MGWVKSGEILDILADEMVAAYQALTITQARKYIRVNAHMTKQPGLPNPPNDAMDDIDSENISKLMAIGGISYMG